MRLVVLAAVFGVVCASLAACDDGASRPAVAPLPTVPPPAQESRDPPPAKPPGIIDNTVSATAADGGAAAADAGAGAERKPEAGPL